MTTTQRKARRQLAAATDEMRLGGGRVLHGAAARAAARRILGVETKADRRSARAATVARVLGGALLGDVV